MESQTPPPVQEPEDIEYNNSLLKYCTDIHKKLQDIPELSSDTNLDLLFLDYRDDLFGGFFGDVFVVPHPSDFRIRGARDIGINPDLLSLLNTQPRLHMCMEGDVWFF